MSFPLMSKAFAKAWNYTCISITFALALINVYC
jgi:hypothetical protein